jgi:hypothetical protein
MAKQGKPYERVVAAILQAFDPRPTVSQGKWVVGPDGRRELDVLIVGTVDGKFVKGLVECKDFNPRTTGPVGIGFIDALDSKRRDLQADLVLLCSNAGFTADAVRKAKRVGIGVAGVLKKGDPRIRFAVIDDVYARKVQLQRMSFTLGGSENIPIRGIPSKEILWNGVPVENWILHRVMLLIGANPIVSGSYHGAHKFLQPLTFSWANGSLVATSLDFSFFITGGWFSHRVEIDSTVGIYDWVRRRVRVPPAAGKLEFRGINFDAGTPVDSPPDREFIRERLLDGEVDMKFLALEKFPRHEPVPALNEHVDPSDLALTITNLSEAVAVSSTVRDR